MSHSTSNGEEEENSVRTDAWIRIHVMLTIVPISFWKILYLHHPAIDVLPFEQDRSYRHYILRIRSAHFIEFPGSNLWSTRRRLRDVDPLHRLILTSWTTLYTQVITLRSEEDWKRRRHWIISESATTWSLHRRNRKREKENFVNEFPSSNLSSIKNTCSYLESIVKTKVKYLRNVCGTLPIL